MKMEKFTEDYIWTECLNQYCKNDSRDPRTTIKDIKVTVDTYELLFIIREKDNTNTHKRSDYPKLEGLISLIFKSLYWYCDEVRTLHKS